MANVAPAAFLHSAKGHRERSEASSKVLPDTPEERMSHLAFGGFGPVFDSSQQRRLNPNAAMRDLLGVGLRISGLRRVGRSLADAVPKSWSTFPA